jgi:hypothetical protein
MLDTLIGLDHLVIAVRDLDAAAAEWAALGFTMSPRGLHSPHMGSGNYTMMFGEDYLELLGVVSPTPHNEALRGFLAGREGMERAAFITTDAEKGAAALRAKGLSGTNGPVHFGRPVPLPDGTETEARFSVFHYPREEAPGGLRIFACQHHTRPAVWVPELQRHANGVTGIRRALVATDTPGTAAAHLARLIEGEVTQDGEFRVVETGPNRASIGFAPRAAIAALARCAEAALPAEGGAAMILKTPTPRPPVLVTGTAVIFEG